MEHAASCVNRVHVIRARATYKVVKIMEGVRVKLPGAGTESLTPMDEHKLQTKDGSIVTIDEHWRHGIQAGRDGSANIWLNRHFFGFDGCDFGRKSTARVEVVEKTTDSGQKFTLLNITKTPDASPKFRLKFPCDGNGKMQIVFEELNPR